MIGVIADPAEHPTVQEFFELFKTPWERAVPWRKYRVILSTVGYLDNFDAEHFLIYGSEDPTSAPGSVGMERVHGPVDLDWAGTTFPIYGRLALFDERDGSRLRFGAKAADYRDPSRAPAIRRIGYDLFREVHHLLAGGQPASRASTPTLELHIALLRQLLLESGMAFVEVPPRPDGYDFICCLTHDVDFFGIRRHPFDRTLAGFIARATLGTLADLVRGRRTLGEAVTNWSSCLSLPLVFLGLASDFWRPFDDYAQVEEPARSTFFLVPFKGKPGMAPDGTADANRAVPYEISEIDDPVRQAAARGSELAVHGIDAWRDSKAGRAEMEQLTARTGRGTAGVRMHWLYFDEGAPAQLEAAGFHYDSTCGHNDAVGYRAGTSQAFRPLGCQQLMELPLSIMDSALFSSGRMGLTPRKATALCGRIVENARRFGGTVVINWHGRSLAPERLWGRFYRELLREVSAGNRAWFATAGEAVDWFRWRRSICFQRIASTDSIVVVALAPPRGPAGFIRFHRPGQQGYEPDIPFNGNPREVEASDTLRSHV